MKSSCWKFYDCNPHHVDTCDSIIRSISTANNQSWENTLRDMVEYSIRKGMVLTTPKLFKQYLTDNGWEEHEKITPEVTFEEFLKDFKDTAICHINDYYTVCVKGGYLYDVVDGSDVPVGNYWTKRS